MCVCVCVCKHYISGVTESLFWGDKRGMADIRLGGGARGRHAMLFFPITFIVHNQNANGGVGGGGGNGGPWCEWGGGAWPPFTPPPPHSYTTVLHNYISYKCMFFFYLSSIQQRSKIFAYISCFSDLFSDNA